MTAQKAAFLLIGVTGAFLSLWLILFLFVFVKETMTVEGKVIDEYTGDIIISANIASDERLTSTDVEGRYRLEEVEEGEVITYTAKGYEAKTIKTTKEISQHVALRPNTLDGVIRDSITEEIVPHAVIMLDEGKIDVADDSGGFHFEDVPRESKLSVQAPGYKAESVAITRTITKEIKLKPFITKGIYLTFYTVGWQQRREYLFGLVDKTELNAVVVDVKGDMGLVNSAVSVPLTRQIGAEVKFADDLKSIVTALKRKGVYTIARIVVFKDSCLASDRPDLAIKDSGSGGLYLDCEGQLWTDPYNKEVWDYNIAIAEQAAAIGFDEIQFDYIRFPSGCIGGSLIYCQESNAINRVKAIEGFLAAAKARLKPLGIFVAADTFGWTTVREDDMGIGQLIENIAEHVDYLCPMVYPSTWDPGSLDLDYPAAYPYQLVHQSLTIAGERLKDIKAVKIRPWLQDFDDYGPRKIPYGAEEVRQQIKAAADTGTSGWMLWDAHVEYTPDALQPSPTESK